MLCCLCNSVSSLYRSIRPGWHDPVMLYDVMFAWIVESAIVERGECEMEKGREKRRERRMREREGRESIAKDRQREDMEFTIDILKHCNTYVVGGGCEASRINKAQLASAVHPNALDLGLASTGRHEIDRPAAPRVPKGWQGVEARCSTASAPE